MYKSDAAYLQSTCTDLDMEQDRKVLRNQACGAM